MTKISFIKMALANFFWFFSLASLADTTRATVLHVLFPDLNIALTPTQVQNASQYLVLEQLLRPLVSYSRRGEIIGDLVDSWHISEDYTRYEFVLKSNQKFSNGQVITSNDVVKTLERLKKSDVVIHYDIKNLKDADAVSDQKFIIKLDRPDPFLLFSLDHPEFRPLHSSDYLKDIGKATLSVTSGAYSLMDRTESSLSLKANEYFTNMPTSGAKTIRFDIITSQKDLSSIDYKKYDLIWSPQQNIFASLSELDFEPYYPRLAFTVFAFLNPKLLSFDERAYLQKVLYSGHFSYSDDITLSSAKQLYLPEGPGRLSDKDASSMWDNILGRPPAEISKEIKILLPTYLRHIDLIESRLTSAKIRFLIVRYENFENFTREINTGNYDVVYTNNDFSSLDLRGSLEVTFNKSRPLIDLSSDHLTTTRVKAEKMVKEANNVKRYNLIYELGKSLIEEAIVIPFYYKNAIIFKQKTCDLSAWSRVVPDFRLWNVTRK